MTGCKGCGLCCHNQTVVSLSGNEKEFYRKHILRLPLIRGIGDKLLELLFEISDNIIDVSGNLKNKQLDDLLDILEELPEHYIEIEKNGELITKVINNADSLNKELLEYIQERNKDISLKINQLTESTKRKLIELSNEIILLSFGLKGLKEKKTLIKGLYYKKIVAKNGEFYYNDSKGEQEIQGYRTNMNGEFYLTPNFFNKFTNNFDKTIEQLNKLSEESLLSFLNELILYISVSKFKKQSTDFNRQEILGNMKKFKTNEDKIIYILSEINKVIDFNPLYLLDPCEFYIPGYGCMIHGSKKPEVCKDYFCEKCTNSTSP